MWADNETDLDLLGFDVLVDELVVALTEPRLLPLTVGVLGGWGSGKSSLLKITRAELEAVEGRPYVCVEFSPWQYEDYGDVKAGLMRAVLDQCRPRMKSAAEEDVRRMKAFASRFARRSRQAGRAAVVAAPAMTPAVAGLIDPTFDPTTVDAAKAAATAVAGVVGESLKDKEVTAPAASPIDNIEDVEDFRRVFEEFVKGLDGVDAVVVFIDDLDRCLPDTVIDTFEAIRLFLNVPRSAFVVAASRQIVEAAIDSRYPELKRENGQGIGHDYLEKMLQLQVSVPPLSAAETETYVNLLISQLHVEPQQFKGACRALRERASDPFAPSYSAAVAADLLGDAFTTALSDDMTWATEIAPALSGLGGNPRRIKRFLNDLTWRRRAAARRGVALRQDVLAKLMVLEDQSGEDFQTLFDWQVRAAGPSPELVFAETLARGDSQKEEVPEGAGRRAKKAEKEPETTPAADPVAELATGWAERPMVRRWLQLQPDLRETNLRPYFSYFRDRLVIGAAEEARARRLSGRSPTIGEHSRLQYDGVTRGGQEASSGLCVSTAVAALTGSSTSPNAACAAVRWIAPHVALAPEEDDLLLEALALADQLCPEAEALWLWWLAQYRADIVSEAAYLDCEALPADLRAVLAWVISHGPDGLAAYVQAADATQAYQRAIRELSRAARDFRSLQEAVDAVQGGARDANIVMGQLPGGWSSPALQGGRKGMVTAAFSARDAALVAGAPLDLPTARLPRFSSVEEPYRGLCLDLLSDLPGSSGTCLLDAPPRLLEFPETTSDGERALLSQQLRARGLPARVVAVDATFWLAAMTGVDEAWVVELQDDGPGAALARALRTLSIGGGSVDQWLASLRGCEGYWSPAQMVQAVEASIAHCVGSGAGADAAEILECLPQTYWDVRDRHLERALREMVVPDITLLAFNIKMRATLTQLSNTQEMLV